MESEAECCSILNSGVRSLVMEVDRMDAIESWSQNETVAVGWCLPPEAVTTGTPSLFFTPGRVEVLEIK